jgi:hypothetical protein
VYRATDTKLNCDAAKKVPRPEVAYNPEYLARLRREGRSSLKLQSIKADQIGNVG